VYANWSEVTGSDIDQSAKYHVSDLVIEPNIGVRKATWV
jgi:hypothetical protein